MEVRRFQLRQHPLAGQLPFSMPIPTNPAVNDGSVRFDLEPSLNLRVRSCAPCPSLPGELRSCCRATSTTIFSIRRSSSSAFLPSK